MSIWALCFVLALPAQAAGSGERDATRMMSLGLKAFAPNAGGQDAYTVRYGALRWELHGFANRYLTAGGFPLLGGGYNLRFPLCNDLCFWQLYVATGGGLSTAGPFAEIQWGLMVPLLPLWLPIGIPKYVPQLRIDFSTQMYMGLTRALVWSYPLWIGFGVAF